MWKFRQFFEDIGRTVWVVNAQIKAAMLVLEMHLWQEKEFGQIKYLDLYSVGNF